MSEEIQKIYEREREKRLAENSQGMRQYLDMESTMQLLESYAEDPWVESGTKINQVVPDGGHIKYLVMGTGFSGLLAVFKLLQYGIKPENLVVVDPAGGCGGTWYWNRFPGLMCDIESYIYLPLLEETGYMPTRKYASGEEIRTYSDYLPKHFGFADRIMFQTTAKNLEWNTTKKVWDCEFLQHPRGLQQARSHITADYVVMATGLFPGPKVADVPGLGSFKGYSFHTSRWDYAFTGGTPADPVLDKLKDKKVAFVGTGATGIQVVPAVAKYAGELSVFQRTPSAVDVRGQKDTDTKEWKEEIATKKGWWAERNENFHSLTQSQDPPPKQDLVNDAFSQMKAYGCVFGSPNDVTPENVQQWIEKMSTLDFPRSEMIRKRATDTVKDASTGRKLQAWYPGWCKRPCFHDDYLLAFNRPNVHLVDAEDAKGITSITEKGVVAGGKEYPVDVIIWGTGYASPLAGSMAGRAGIKVFGENGASMEQRALEGTLDTLHGCIAPDFPNFLYFGLAQSGTGPNQTHRMEVTATHIAYILTEAEKKANGQKAIVKVTPEAAEEWADKVASTALTTAPMLECLPSYFNLEGDIFKLPEEVKAKLARGGTWGRGVNDFAKLCADWRADGSLKGIAVSAA